MTRLRATRIVAGEPGADFRVILIGALDSSMGPSWSEQEQPMTFNLIVLQPAVALIAGILILIIPRLLNYIVAAYLIVIGLSGLLGR